MSDYVLSCCSTADISREHFAARNIQMICFHFTVNGASYPDDLGASYPFEAFYADMAAGAETSTSQVNVAEYLEYFSRFLAEGKDVLHVCFSGGLSGSVNSARNAALIAQERFPERQILIVDSLCASSGYGLLMDALADRRDAGADIHQLADWAEANKLRVHHWFFSTDLSFYVKGGRISKAAGWFGTVLNICPLLNMDNNGRLVPRYKVRTKKKVIAEIVEKMAQYADGGEEYSGRCYICHAACPQDAAEVAALVEQRFPHLNGKVEINWVGTTIGSHTGPGTVALFFWGSERVD